MIDTNAILDNFRECIFSDDLSEENYEELIVENLNRQFLRDLEYTSGISKMVFIPIGEKYVIKIPFRGSCTGQSYIDEETGLTFYEYIGFEGAYNSNNTWDYCLKEAEIYEDSIKEELDKVFAKTKLLGYVNRYPIYIQEKCEVFSEIKEEKCDSPRETSMSKFCTKEGYIDFNLTWMADAYDYYGEEYFKKLMNFLKSEGIYDLHGGNIGYINSRPVIFDFSDYNC